MMDYEKVWDFQNLYKVHTVARRGKRNEKEVIEFELHFAENLISGYYSFMVYAPKKREVHALYYVDRVVPHCLCDEALTSLLGRRLIYDNAACRLGKGTHFAIKRLSKFMKRFYKNNGQEGFFLKCDVRKFFNCIDVDSFEVTPDKGIPMGNQTNQWFAIYYLDGLDRLKN